MIPPVANWCICWNNTYLANWSLSAERAVDSLWKSYCALVCII